MKYEGFLIGVASRNDQWFYVDVQGSPWAPSGGALCTEFSTLVELVDVVLLPDGLARTATSPNEAQACRIWTVTVRPKILSGTVAKGALSVALFKTSVGSLLRIVHLLHQCYNLHISSPLLLMCVRCCAPWAKYKCNQLYHLCCKHPCPQVFFRLLLRK